MSRGKRLPGGNGDSYTIMFTLNTAGAPDEATAFASATATALAVGPYVTGTGSRQTRAAIPFDCAVDQIMLSGEILADTDEIRINMLKYDDTNDASATQLISNSVDGDLVVDYFRSVATAVNQSVAVVYDGLPEAEGSSALGFVESSVAAADAQLAAGNEFEITIDSAVAADSISHVKVFVTLARKD